MSYQSSLLRFLSMIASDQKLRTNKPRQWSEKDGLYPIQALVQPVALRFKYHFEGTRQTNRLDKVCVNRRLLSLQYSFAHWSARMVFHAYFERVPRTSAVHGERNPSLAVKN